MRKQISLITMVLVLSFGLKAQKGYVPTKENLENRVWFQNAKFGMFIHWGIYAQLAGGGKTGVAEWIMEKNNIPVHAYEKLAGFFNPLDFDATEWVAMAKAAGIQYITITTKHHDGFAMYDSKVSDYNIVKCTPFGKDILKLLKAACDKQGIKLFFYYSQLDWHHPDYYPYGKTGTQIPERTDSGDWPEYIDYMNAQLTELLTNYGPIGGIWFDGMWDKKDAPWRLEETYALIHKLQPAALIGSNHHLAPIEGEDFQMFERDLPGHNSMGFNQTGTISELPLEMCETMNGSWGYNLVDDKYKSSKRLIQTMVKAAGYGANFLLNTGPMPNGKIQPENIDTFKIMGLWLNQYGETIYGTRKGPIAPCEWGASTRKEDNIYVHILDWDKNELLIPNISEKIKSISYFDGGEKVKYKKTTSGLVLSLSEKLRKPIDTILVIETK